MEDREAAKIGAFVRGGGGLIVFAGDRVTAEGCRTLSQAGLIPGAIGAHRLASELPIRFGSWSHEHPLMRAFNDPQHGDLMSLTFGGYTPLEPAAGAEVIATFNDGSPAIVEQSVGAGRVLWFASACDLGWGDWVRTALYVPLVHQMLGRLTGVIDGGAVRSVVVNNDAAKPGVYERDGYSLVVNMDPRESEVQRCTEGALRSRFGLAASGAEAGSPSAAAPDGPPALTALEIRRNEVWQWVLVALVAVAALEFGVANRVAA